MEVYCPALAVDGDEFPYAVPARGWLWRKHRRPARCSACGETLPAETHPPNPDDAVIARLVRERDAADDGRRHTLNEVLREHGIDRASLQV